MTGSSTLNVFGLLVASFKSAPGPDSNVDLQKWDADETIEKTMLSTRVAPVGRPPRGAHGEHFGEVEQP